jgi:hypothetical protein
MGWWRRLVWSAHCPNYPFKPQLTMSRQRRRRYGQKDKTCVSEERCGCDELGQTRMIKVEAFEDGAARHTILTASCIVCQEVQRTL